MIYTERYCQTIRSLLFFLSVSIPPSLLGISHNTIPKKEEYKLILTVALDHIDGLKDILSKHKNYITYQNQETGHTVFTIGALNNSIHVIEWLLKQPQAEKMINMKIKKNIEWASYTPLMLASAMGYYQVVNLILEAVYKQHMKLDLDKKVEEPSYKGFTALTFLVKEYRATVKAEKKKIFKKLIQKIIYQGASIDSQSRFWVGKDTTLLKCMQKAAMEYQVQKNHERLANNRLKNSLILAFSVTTVTSIGYFIIQLFPQSQPQ